MNESWMQAMPCAGWALPSRNWGWQTKDGKYIRIKDAETSHLQNLVAKMRRDRNIDNDIYYPALAEISRRVNA